MKIHIKTKELDLNFDDEKLLTAYHFSNINKPVLDFVKECIQKVSDESIKIKQGNAN